MSPDLDPSWVSRDVVNWREEALCRNVDPETFYMPDGARGPFRAKKEREAKAVCYRCPVMAECRQQRDGDHGPLARADAWTRPDGAPGPLGDHLLEGLIEGRGSGGCPVDMGVSKHSATGRHALAVSV